MHQVGVVELLVTSDGPNDIERSIYLAPKNGWHLALICSFTHTHTQCHTLSLSLAVLTINFQSHTSENIETFKTTVPNRPLMVMEYWTGWFDHWGHKHLDRDISVEEITQNLNQILSVGGSFNLYMFHGKVQTQTETSDMGLCLVFSGGTSFGFMNGANIDSGEYLPQVTSYGNLPSVLVAINVNVSVISYM